MPIVVKTPDEVLTELLLERQKVKWRLAKGIKRVEEEDRKLEFVDPKWDHKRLEQLDAEIAEMTNGPVATNRVRQVRMIGRKGY